MKKKLVLPKFKNEDAERKFWDTHSSVDYFDWSKAANVIFPNLKPSSTPISIRLPNYMISELKVKANSKRSLLTGTPYTRHILSSCYAG